MKYAIYMYTINEIKTIKWVFLPPPLSPFTYPFEHHLLLSCFQAYFPSSILNSIIKVSMLSLPLGFQQLTMLEYNSWKHNWKTHNSIPLIVSLGHNEWFGHLWHHNNATKIFNAATIVPKTCQWCYYHWCFEFWYINTSNGGLNFCGTLETTIQKNHRLMP